MDVKTIELRKTILEDNDKDADLLREQLRQCGTYYMNIMSSPGSGKTTTLIATIRQLQKLAGPGKKAGHAAAGCSAAGSSVKRSDQTISEHGKRRG